MKENEKTNTQNNNINSGDKLGYLQLIQEPICRMSTISAIFKGFAAAIVGGIAMISFKYINLIVLGLSFLPVFAFAMLDIYYLKLEKSLDITDFLIIIGIHRITVVRIGRSYLVANTVTILFRLCHGIRSREVETKVKLLCQRECQRFIMCLVTSICNQIWCHRFI